MTWNELIAQLTEDQKNEQVSIYVETNGTYCNAAGVEVCKEDDASYLYVTA